MISLIDTKKKLRKKQYENRKKLFSDSLKNFNLEIFRELFKKKIFSESKIISSYISINNEIDTSELNNYIQKKNKILCFPTVFKKNYHLVFRKFSSEEDLVEGFMNIKEPSSNNEILTPDILFVPCLAFDTQGFRLGYGGGFYDRTFAHLKKNKKNFISVGYAFEGQKVSSVPKDKFDIKLNYVITEKKIYNFK